MLKMKDIISISSSLGGAAPKAVLGINFETKVQLYKNNIFVACFLFVDFAVLGSGNSWFLVSSVS